LSFGADGIRPADWFSADPRTFVARAPGRLDVMGGIADYSGALVLQLPLGRYTTVTLRRQAAPSLDVASFRDGCWHTFSITIDTLFGGELREPEQLAAWFAQRDSDRWAAYVVGAIQHVMHRRGGVPRALPGFRLLVESSVPEGKGVSSSAALEVATMMAAAAACDVTLSPVDIALACQRVENVVVGAPCGIMDQMTSACGEANKLLRLRCQPASIEGHLAIPRGYRFYGIDSGVRHAVSGADYGTVRTAAFMGYRMIAQVAGLRGGRFEDRTFVSDEIWHGYLANILPRDFEARFRDRLPERMSGAQFLAAFDGITDAVTSVVPDRVYPVRSATAHPIYEQARIDRFTELLRRLGDDQAVATELGELMYGSHESYSACGLGSEATDRLVEMLKEAGPASGVFGAKITGGGSGGTVAILGTESVESVVRDIAARYTAETGRVAEVFAESGPGAAKLGVVVTEATD
jgi:L-arabinokinase